METSKPIQKFRAGQVGCALWENEVTIGGEKQVILKASVSRRYKDRDGKWKTSQSFSRNEIPLAIFVLFQAFEAMLTAGKEQTDAEVSEEVVE